MVNGLDVFRDHFRDYVDRYIMIGGTACDLAMAEAGLTFRATHDLDIVLCIEVIDTDFARAFWEFIKLGGYRRQETSIQRQRYYRFQKPTDRNYPAMLELFSRVPDALAIDGLGELTPIPISGEISSLSAIILDDVYYGWIRAGRRDIRGVPTVGPGHLIPLKVSAWLDLRSRRSSGQTIDRRNIRKHKNDVFRLYGIIDPETRLVVAPPIRSDLQRFFSGVQDEPNDLRALGLGAASLEAVLGTLRSIYRLPDSEDSP